MRSSIQLWKSRERISCITPHKMFTLYLINTFGLPRVIQIQAVEIWNALFNTIKLWLLWLFALWLPLLLLGFDRYSNRCHIYLLTQYMLRISMRLPLSGQPHFLYPSLNNLSQVIILLPLPLHVPSCHLLFKSTYWGVTKRLMKQSVVMQSNPNILYIYIYILFYKNAKGST